MLGRSPTEMRWAGSMSWPEEGLTHPKWLVSVVARQVAHYRKNGFVQTWPRVGRCPNDRAGLLWLSTAVGRFDAPGRKWAIVLGDLVLGVGWREGVRACKTRNVGRDRANGPRAKLVECQKSTGTVFGQEGLM